VDFLNLLPSSRIMALGSTQPLTEMSTRNIPGGKERPALKADNLTAICEPIVWQMWDTRRLTTLWASTACYRDSFTFFTSLMVDNIVFINLKERDSQASLATNTPFHSVL
jgi:hypothetical protein